MRLPTWIQAFVGGLATSYLFLPPWPSRTCALAFLPPVRLPVESRRLPKPSRGLDGAVPPWEAGQSFRLTDQAGRGP
eukprot:6345801-Heterocapsa_arctica.AAC.1